MGCRRHWHCCETFQLSVSAHSMRWMQRLAKRSSEIGCVTWPLRAHSEKRFRASGACADLRCAASVRVVRFSVFLSRSLPPPTRLSWQPCAESASALRVPCSLAAALPAARLALSRARSCAAPRFTWAQRLCLPVARCWPVQGWLTLWPPACVRWLLVEAPSPPLPTSRHHLPTPP